MKLNLIKGTFLTRSALINNSLWGLVSSVFQTLFLSVLFIIVSRHYTVIDFSYFLIANTIYQLIVGFSSMGLGHWFIREYESNQDRTTLTYRFVKIQTLLGIMFYVINIGLAFLIYNDVEIRWLTIILGTNIIFDNIIYALKSLNTAQWQQKKTAIIMAVDGLLRLLIGCILFFYPLSILMFSVLLVLVRLLTVNLFLRIGSAGIFNLSHLLKFKVTISDFKKQILANWKFLMIVGSSIIFWRSATIIISKFLTANDVADYEISYKVYQIFSMLPLVASTTIYPKVINLFAQNATSSIKAFYNNIFLGYTVFTFVCYAFIQSFSTQIIPLVFGAEFSSASECVNQMFLIFLVFPTVLLQASIIVAMKLEKLDMLCNFFTLVLNLACCFIGLYYFKSLSVINYSMFASFLAFHFAQSIILIQLKVTSLKNVMLFYLLLALFVFGYKYALDIFNSTFVFIGFAFFIGSITSLVFYTKIKSLLGRDIDS